jgi:hypothetical protein
MTKNDTTHPHSTQPNTSDPSPASEAKPAKETSVPPSLQPIIAFNTVLLVIFLCLAEKNILSFAHAAQYLEDAVEEMTDLPDLTRAFLLQIIATLWGFEKGSDRNKIN